MSKKIWLVSFRADDELVSRIQSAQPSSPTGIAARELVESALDRRGTESHERREPPYHLASSFSVDTPLVTELAALERIASDLERRIAALRRQISGSPNNGGAK